MIQLLISFLGIRRGYPSVYGTSQGSPLEGLYVFIGYLLYRVMNQNSDLIGKITLSKSNRIEIKVRLVIAVAITVIALFSLLYLLIPFNGSVDLIIFSILSGLLLFGLLAAYFAWRELREKPLSDKEEIMCFFILIIDLILLYSPIIKVIIY
jgi:hypothetical protein